MRYEVNHVVFLTYEKALEFKELNENNGIKTTDIYEILEVE